MRRRSGHPQDLQLIEPNAENHYEVDEHALPLSCPMPGMYLWNSHPKVYLPVEATGQAKCGYCGAVYTLVRKGKAGEPAEPGEAA